MPRLSIQTRQRVIIYLRRGDSVSTIKKRLEEDNIFISARALYNLVAKYRDTNSVVDRPRRKMPRKITPEMMTAIDAQLHCNDEMTSSQLYNYLKENWPDIEVSLPTIRRVRNEIGWVCTKPHYCQMLREVGLCE